MSSIDLWIDSESLEIKIQDSIVNWFVHSPINLLHLLLLVKLVCFCNISGGVLTTCNIKSNVNLNLNSVLQVLMGLRQHVYKLRQRNTPIYSKWCGENKRDEKKPSGLVATMNMESKNTEITKNITIKSCMGIHDFMPHCSHRAHTLIFKFSCCCSAFSPSTLLNTWSY